jgi:hypothetical protein
MYRLLVHLPDLPSSFSFALRIYMFKFYGCGRPSLSCVSALAKQSDRAITMAFQSYLYLDFFGGYLLPSMPLYFRGSTFYLYQIRVHRTSPDQYAGIPFFPPPIYILDFAIAGL